MSRLKTPRADPLQNPVSSGSSLLIADDDELLRETLGRVFSKAGYTVTLAPDGLEAVRLVKDRKFDAIIADLSMPKKTGLEVLEEAKGLAPGTPVIILSAFGDWGIYATALSLGVYKFMSKPCRLHDLLDTVREAIKEKGERRKDEREANKRTDE